MPELIVAFILELLIFGFLLWRWRKAELELIRQQQMVLRLTYALHQRDQLIIRLCHECDIHGCGDEQLLAEARLVSNHIVSDADSDFEL